MMLLFVGRLEVRLERHDAGLLRHLEQLIEHRQQIAVVVLATCPAPNSVVIWPSSRLITDGGVPMSRLPSAAPPMMMNSAG